MPIRIWGGAETESGTDCSENSDLVQTYTPLDSSQPGKFHGNDQEYIFSMNPDETFMLPASLGYLAKCLLHKRLWAI